MERFTPDFDKLIKDKTQELYLDICKKIIETNGLKAKAFEISRNYCDEHIRIESKKDPLFSYADTWKKIKNELNELEKNTD